MVFDATTITVVVGAVVSVASAWFGYLGAKAKLSKDFKVSERESFLKEREQLATQQSQFQQKMVDQFHQLREMLLVEQKRNLKLEDTVAEWEDKYKELEEEWEEKYNILDRTWKEKYKVLEEENHKLQERVNELEKKKSQK